jgi:hypothetical protein
VSCAFRRFHRLHIAGNFALFPFGAGTFALRGGAFLAGAFALLFLMIFFAALRAGLAAFLAGFLLPSVSLFRKFLVASVSCEL